jgi:hypothetical protein
MAIRAFGGGCLGVIVFIVLAMATLAIVMHGVGDVSPFFLFGQAFGLFAFHLPGLVVAFKAQLDFIAFFQIRAGFAFVIVVTLPAGDFMFGCMLFVRERNDAFFVLEIRFDLDFIRRFCSGTDTSYQQQACCQGDNQHYPQGPFVHQLYTSF